MSSDISLSAPRPSEPSASAPATTAEPQRAISQPERTDHADDTDATGNSDSAHGGPGKDAADDGYQQGEQAGDPEPTPPEDAASSTADAPQAKIGDRGSGGQARTIYGIVSVGNRLMGIETMHLREAVPFPEALSPMALALPNLLGAMMLREDTIPLVDLAGLLNLSSEVPITERVVIIINDTTHERLLGLVVDSLQGMTSLDIDTAAEMGVVGYQDLFVAARSFIHDGAVVAILDTQKLFDRDGLPFARKRGRDNQQRRSTRPLSRQSYLLCGYAGYGLAFPTQHIHATIPMTTLKNSPLAHGLCDGVVEYHGIDVPVLDTLSVLGLGRNFSKPERSASVAMRVPSGGIVAFEIDRFFDIINFRDEDLARVPAILSPRPELFYGALITPSSDHYLALCPDNLLKDHAVRQFASTNADQSAGEAEEGTGKHKGSSLYLLSSSAQKQTASPLSEIYEILPLPQHLLYADIRHDGFMGILAHRAQLIPLFSVANVLGDCPFYEEGKACIVIFRHEEQFYGAVVEHLVGMTRCRKVGRPEDSTLLEVESGKILALFDFARELPLPAAAQPVSGNDRYDLF